MRLHIVSDLHLEFAPLALPPVEADVTICAGDVHTGLNACAPSELPKKCDNG